jgi:MYXO-CTERM domain-containing protein
LPEQFLPFDLGTTYYAIDLAGGTDQALHVDLTGDPGAQWGLVWAVWREGAAATTGTALVGDGEALTADIPLAGGTRVKLGVVNAGPADLVADLHVPRRSFVLDPSLGAAPPTTTTGDPYSDPTVGAPPADGGDAVASEAPGGCGCAVGRAPRPTSFVAMLLVSLAWLGSWSRSPRSHQPWVRIRT